MIPVSSSLLGGCRRQKEKGTVYAQRKAGFSNKPAGGPFPSRPVQLQHPPTAVQSLKISHHHFAVHLLEFRLIRFRSSPFAFGLRSSDRSSVRLLRATLFRFLFPLPHTLPPCARHFSIFFHPPIPLFMFLSFLPFFLCMFDFFSLSFYSISLVFTPPG